MYILLSDESNSQPSRKSKFFIYGGLVIDIQKLPFINYEIEKIRQKARYDDKDEFKFETRSRPDYVACNVFNKAKENVIELCMKQDVKFIAHIIHHRVIRNQKPFKFTTQAANYVLGRFNIFLNNIKDFGIVVIDNLPEKKHYQYLSEKYRIGLTFPDKPSTKLDKIQLYSSASINSSNACSAMDIVLGAFRYSINTFPDNKDITSNIMKNVFSMMLGRNAWIKDQNTGGLIIRPPYNEIRVQEIKNDYDFLFRQIKEMLNFS